MKIILVGARADGQAHVAQEAVQAEGEHEVVGFLDDTPGLAGTEVLGLPVLGPVDAVAEARTRGAVGFHVAIGDGAARLALGARLEEAGLEPVTVIHPRAGIAPSATLGRGVFVGALAVVSTGASVGDHALVPPSSFVSHHVVVEAGASLSPGSRLAGRSRLGRAAFLGLGASVLPDCTVGAGAVVGAGALVTRDVAPDATVVGVPAKVRPAASDRA